MKILLVGNESNNTNLQTEYYARKNNSVNHGIVLDADFEPVKNGYYHISVADLAPGEIIRVLASKFDSIELLEQDISTYSHYKVFVTTIRLMYDLEKLNFPVTYRNKKTSQIFLYWKEYLKINKSFCFYPTVAFVERDKGEIQICPKQNFSIKGVPDVNAWNTNPELNSIRDKMEQGILMEGDICSVCRLEEQYGDESARQFETLELAVKLQAKSTADFRKFKNPVYYEIRPSNKCNIRCRTCDDGFSHLIEREWKQLKFPLVDWKFNSSNFNNIEINTLEKVYFGGGEPTIQPELYSFLRKCIKQNKTNFSLNIGTNGYKISDTLLDLLDSFPNVCFAFSFDGAGIVNDYIRWGTKFDVVVENSRRVRARGHQVSLQTVFSMYSLTRLYEVYEFYDREFSNTGLLVNLAGTGEYGQFDPLNHPLPDLVLSSLERCKNTKTYFTNGRSAKSNVDLLINYYSDPNYKVDVEKLKIFFNYNDKLDLSRGSKLEDYIPELAQSRLLYNI